MSSAKVLFACYSGPWIELRWATKAPRGEGVRLEKPSLEPRWEVRYNPEVGYHQNFILAPGQPTPVINTVVFVGGRSIGYVRARKWPKEVPKPTRRKAVLGLSPEEAAQVKQFTWRGKR